MINLKESLAAHYAAKKRLQEGGGNGAAVSKLGPQCRARPNLPGPVCYIQQSGGAAPSSMGATQEDGPPGPRTEKGIKR
jgi:hypothetical protein